MKSINEEYDEITKDYEKKIQGLQKRATQPVDPVVLAAWKARRRRRNALFARFYRFLPKFLLIWVLASVLGFILMMYFDLTPIYKVYKLEIGIIPKVLLLILLSGIPVSIFIILLDGIIKRLFLGYRTEIPSVGTEGYDLFADPSASGIPGNIFYEDEKSQELKHHHH